MLSRTLRRARIGYWTGILGGAVALCSVLPVGLTGTVLAVTIIGSVSALVGTTYGRLLLIKIGLVVVVGAVAAWNRYWLVPRFTRNSAGTLAWPRLLRTIRLEAVGLVLVLGLTSVLTMQNPRAVEP